MNEFRVPKLEQEVRIRLDDGRVLDGRLFLSPTGPEGRPETVLDHLNDPQQEFLPLACGDDRFLINKTGIITVTVTHADDEPERAGEHRVAVRLSLAGGTHLIGTLAIVARPERSRVLDFLNAAPRFLSLEGEGHVTLVHKRYVVTVRASQD